MLDDASKGAVNWLYKVKILLESAGFSKIWMFPDSVIGSKIYPHIKAKIYGHLHCELERGNARLFFPLSVQKVKYSYQQVPYFYKLLNKKHRNAIAKLRLSSHPLLIETGRYSGIPWENRKCIYCDMDDIEDEFHFVCKCTNYTMLRNAYIPKYYSRNPSMHKFMELLNSDKLKTLKKTCYIYHKSVRAEITN